MISDFEAKNIAVGTVLLSSSKFLLVSYQRFPLEIQIRNSNLEWTLDSKGQLISKCLFGIFNSPKKQRKNSTVLYYYGTSSRIVFVRFSGELKTSKRHFEIN